jgi:hypothetical protein
MQPDFPIVVEALATMVIVGLTAQSEIGLFICPAYGNRVWTRSGYRSHLICSTQSNDLAVGVNASRTITTSRATS